MRNPGAAAAVVVVIGTNLPALELIETALNESGHRALMTTRPAEVIELARSIRIDVLVGEHSDALTALEEEITLPQPDVRTVRTCDPDELQVIGRNGAAIAAPVSLHELEVIVGEAVAHSGLRTARPCAWRCRD